MGLVALEHQLRERVMVPRGLVCHAQCVVTTPCVVVQVDALRRDNAVLSVVRDSGGFTKTISTPRFLGIDGLKGGAWAQLGGMDVAGGLWKA